jgi:hypothetical protein
MAGDEFGMLLNNFYSPVSAWDRKMLSGLLEDRISTAYTQMLGRITKLCQGMFQKMVPILVHGYDYPVPDGRGFLGGWPFPGPWLEPGFRQKNFEDLGQRISMMMDVMDRFNKLVSGLSKSPGLEHVRYIDLRDTLQQARQLQTLVGQRTASHRGRIYGGHQEICGGVADAPVAVS